MDQERWRRLQDLLQGAWSLAPRALKENRETFGDTHPATKRMEALARATDLPVSASGP